MRALREWLWAPVLIFFGILSGLITAPDAAASPTTDAIHKYGTGVVCATLDEYPTADGVVGVLSVFIEDGWTPGQAADIVYKSVEAYCDEHMPAIQAFVDEYTKPVVAA